jgi:hypothetical protein
MPYRRPTWTSWGIVIASIVLAGSGIVSAQQPAEASRDDQIIWHDCRALGVEGKGWADTAAFYDRLPAKAQATVPRQVWAASRCCAGLCIRFATDASSLKVRWTLLNADFAKPHFASAGRSGVDLYAKDREGRWRFSDNAAPQALTTTSDLALPPDSGQCLLYLPPYNGIRSIEIGAAKGRVLTACRSKLRRPVVVYGTSITQGGCASRPGMAWTAIVGRTLDVPIINLGFSGSGKMEPAMADLLAELDPSVYVLDCLANMSPQMVERRVEPFVRKLRSAHPITPIVLAEDSSFRNVCPTANGRVLRGVYEKLTATGVQGVFFLSGHNMLGNDGEGTVDGTHPSDLGMVRLADVFANSLRPLMPH